MLVAMRNGGTEQNREKKHLHVGIPNKPTHAASADCDRNNFRVFTVCVSLYGALAIGEAACRTTTCYVCVCVCVWLCIGVIHGAVHVPCKQRSIRVSIHIIYLQHEWPAAALRCRNVLMI